MADYLSQYTGPEIDQRLTKVSQLEASKQDKLVSGTNIKTVGGTSILGSGDIPIQAGDTNAVKYVSQTLTDAQKAQARSNIDAQKTLVSGQNIKTINNQSILGDGNIDVQGEDGVGLDDVSSAQDGTVVFTLTNGDKVTIDFNHVHPQYYSKEVETSQPQGGFLPDVIYKLGTLTGSVTFSLEAAVTGNANHYFWMFDTGSTAPTITWPAGLTWADGSAPTVAASKHYEVSIMDGIAAYLEV